MTSKNEEYVEVTFTARREHLDTEQIEFADVDISNPYIIDRLSNRRRRSPIMVEFADPEIEVVDLQRAMEAGMNIAKFRMAYSTTDEKIKTLSNLDKAALGYSQVHGHVVRSTATCATLKTWLIKSGIIRDDLEYITFVKDSIVTVTNDKEFVTKTSERTVFIDYAHIEEDVKPEMEISFDQGEVVMRCIATVDSKTVECIVTKGGNLRNIQPVSIRNLVRTTPFLDSIDIQFLKFCCKYEVDMIIIYYVSNREAILKIKRLLSKVKFKPLLFSAICCQQGLDNLEEIVKESDGIVFTRELLEFEIDSCNMYRMVQIQKWVSGMCQKAGKPLFLSGGVFQELLTSGDITDAEIADITNAIMDGITGFILRNCYDIQNTLMALCGLNEICCEVEPLTFNKSDFWRILREVKMPVNAAEAAVIAAMGVANQTNSRVIVIPTVTGLTVRSLIWLRPACIVITISSKPHVVRRLCYCRNVFPLLLESPAEKEYYKTAESRIDLAAKYAVYKAWLKTGDMYIALQRSSPGSPFCDMVRVWTVTFNRKLLIECEYDSDQFKAPADKKKPIRKKKKKKKKEIKKAQATDADALENTEGNDETGEAQLEGEGQKDEEGQKEDEQAKEE